MAELSEEAKEHLLEYPIETWCRSFFDTICKNQKVENNLVESFNSWIVEPRHKPIIGMLEEIRLKVMEMMRSNEEEVSEGTDKHIVNLATKKCSCRVWDLTGIPCPHAIKALLHSKLDPKKEIHWWYSKEAYILTYHYKLQPVPGPKFWKIDPLAAMEPPPFVKLVGRPREKRKRDKDALKRQTEWVAPRRGRVMSCSTCGVVGHNARGCEKEERQSSQPSLGNQTLFGQSFGQPPDYEYPSFEEEVEDDLLWRTRGVSELKSRI
ncbi:uncharacterized protein LOC132637635 [Lycium barbarum]|uniref:uncharacterized protein LOC132637635 n=1 Tax=Lycium barbarum TaxID=112863 RepID=UPI00293EC253|nr:uncharacterized protein LOC132637635 [Lycium barbarum]